MESHDYEHYRNLTLMFFLEKLVDKGGIEAKGFTKKGLKTELTLIGKLVYEIIRRNLSLDNG